MSDKFGENYSRIVPDVRAGELCVVFPVDPGHLQVPGPGDHVHLRGPGPVGWRKVDPEQEDRPEQEESTHACIMSP